MRQEQLILIVAVTAFLLLTALSPSSGLAVAAIFFLIYSIHYKPMESKTYHVTAQIDADEETVEDVADCHYETNSVPVHVNSEPIPINTTSNVVLGDEEFNHPGRTDRACEDTWFSKKSYKDKQRDAIGMHRQMRRSTAWSDTGRWTKEDRDRYEMARRRQEYEIASSLRPDPYMIIERDPAEDYSATSEQPFASLAADHQLFHRARFSHKFQGTGDIAGLLRTKI